MLKDVNLFPVVQLALLLVLDVLIEDVQFFIAGPEVLQLLIIQLLLFYNFFILGLSLLHVEVPTEMLLLCCAVLVGLELGVEFDWSFILGGGIVEVKIKESVVHLLLDSILVGHPEEIDSAYGEKEIDLSLFHLLVVEDEGLHPKPADVLQSVDHAIVLDGEGVEDAVEGVYALKLEDFLLLMLIDELGLLDDGLDGVEGELHPHPDIMRIHIFLILLHLLRDLFFHLAVHALQFLRGRGDETREGKVAPS